MDNLPLEKVISDRGIRDPATASTMQGATILELGGAVAGCCSRRRRVTPLPASDDETANLTVHEQEGYSADKQGLA